MTVLSMLSVMRKVTFPNLRIEYIFPIRGHSFLPADRVFGRIERQIRKEEVILHPDGYYAILHQHGNLHVYGDDWQAADYKSATQACVRTQRSFKISDARMLLLHNDHVGFKSTYAGNYSYHTVLKWGKQWADFDPLPLGMVSSVAKNKMQDVEKLLSDIGASEVVQQFYAEALRAARDLDEDSNSDSSQEDNEQDNEP